MKITTLHHRGESGRGLWRRREIEWFSTRGFSPASGSWQRRLACPEQNPLEIVGTNGSTRENLICHQRILFLAKINYRSIEFASAEEEGHRLYGIRSCQRPSPRARGRGCQGCGAADRKPCRKPKRRMPYREPCRPRRFRPLSKVGP